MILFKVNGKCGYPLHDALKKCYTGLDGRDERMFHGFKSSISLRFEVRVFHRYDPNDGLQSFSTVVAIRKVVKAGQCLPSRFITQTFMSPIDSNFDLEEEPRKHQPRKTRH